MKRIILYGGTFNPPHEGHLSAVRAAIQAILPKEVVWMPSACPPHKKIGEHSPNITHRLKMSLLATAPMKNVRVSELEILRNFRYTYHTVRELMKENDEIWLLLGEDMFLSLEGWYKSAELMACCPIAALKRSQGSDEREMRNAAMCYRDKYGAKIRIIEHEAIDISSTQLRRKLALRQECSELPDSVYRYILDNGLYLKGG